MLSKHRVGQTKLSALTLDIEVGDTVLMGRFKNSPKVVKDIGTDELGQPTINGKKALTFRIKKLMPEKKAACLLPQYQPVNSEMENTMHTQKSATFAPAPVRPFNPLTHAFDEDSRKQLSAGLLRLLSARNHPKVVKDIGTDELGQPTINGKKALTFRIKKLMPEKKAMSEYSVAIEREPNSGWDKAKGLGKKKLETQEKSAMEKSAISLTKLREVLKRTMVRNKDYIRAGRSAAPDRPHGVMTRGRRYPRAAADLLKGEHAASGAYTLPRESAKVMGLGDKPLSLISGNLNYDMPNLLSSIANPTAQRAPAVREMSNRLKYLHESNELQALRRTGTPANMFHGHVNPGIVLKDLRVSRSLLPKYKSVADEIAQFRAPEVAAMNELIPGINKVKLNAKNIRKLSDILVQRGIQS